MRISTTLTAASAALLLAMTGVSSALAQSSSYAEDRAKIEDLAARYLFALDFQDPEAYAATFTEDGILDYGVGQIRGREAIAAMVANMRSNAQAQREADTSGIRPAAGRHNITNIVIEINGERAYSTSYWFHVGNNNPDRSAQLNSFGHYEDELVKVNGQWLYSKRKIYNEQVAEWAAGLDNPVYNPGDGPRQRAN